MKRLALTIVAIVVLIILYKYDPLSYAAMPKCTFKMLTGYSCPGCGFQRSIHAFLNGQIGDGIRCNYFQLYSLPYFFLLTIERFCLPDCGLRDKLRYVAEHRIAVWLYVVLYFVWFIARNIWGI